MVVYNVCGSCKNDGGWKGSGEAATSIMIWGQIGRLAEQLLTFGN
jgi:hypothetical protein